MTPKETQAVYTPRVPTTGRTRAAGWIPLAALLLVSSARAQDDAPPSTPPPSAGEIGESLKLPSAFGTVEVGGRFSVREAVDAKGLEAWAGKLSIPSARLEVTYSWKKRLKAVVEYDFTDGLEGLKDAYAWLDIAGGFSLRAGQFKVPLSLVELESATKLPLVRRGLLRDVLDDGLGLTGRGLGAQLEWKCTGCERALKLRAGVWQMGADEKVAVVNGLGLVPGVRGTWEVLDSLELGASALGTSSQWTAGLDAKHSLPIGQGELRTWAEVLVGRTNQLAGSDGPLLMARAVTAWRIGGGRKGALYVEPFVMLSALDTNLQLEEDRLWEVGGGLNFGQRNRWRLQVQVESRRAEASVPAAVQSLDKSLTERRAALLQMEVSF